MEKICGIYCIKNLINYKCYIGQSQDIYRRWSVEKNSLNKIEDAWNIHLQRAWKKYGEQNFEFSIIEICDIEYLNEREIFWISHFDTYNNGYNQTLGGEGCRGHVLSDETREKIRVAAIGRVLSEETKQKLSAIHTGVVFTTERRKKIGDANRKRVYSDEQKDRMRNSQKTCIQVFCIELNKSFDSLRQAGKEVKIAYHHIKACCEGKQKSAGKHPTTGEPLHWYYTDSITQQNELIME